MNAIERFFKKLDPFFNGLSAFLLAAMVLCIVLQVVFRWFGISIPWSVEASQYLFVWLTFVAGYAGARKAQHIGVEMVQNLFPSPVKRAMQFLSWLLAAFYFGLVFVYCVSLWPKLMTQTSPMLKLPMAMVYLGMMIGLFMMAVYYIYYAVRCLLPQPAAETAAGKEATPK